MHGVVTRLKFFPAHVVKTCLGLELHLIQARRQTFDHVQRGDQLVVFFARDVASDKNAQVPHAFMQHINDGASGGGNGAFVAPRVNDPVQGLRRRRDVVTPGGKHHHWCGDLAQVNGLAALIHGAARQAVADKQVFHNRFDLAAGHAEIATPPAFKLQKPLGFGVHRRPQVVVFVPQGVGRVQLLEIFHQVGTIKTIRTEVAGKGRQPRTAQ